MSVIERLEERKNPAKNLGFGPTPKQNVAFTKILTFLAVSSEMLNLFRMLFFQDIFWEKLWLKNNMSRKSIYCVMQYTDCVTQTST